jgi:hypothetical protein
MWALHLVTAASAGRGPGGEPTSWPLLDTEVTGCSWNDHVRGTITLRDARRLEQGDLDGTDEIENQIREHVAAQIGKLARPKRILWADDLPKTRSGKIMRRLLRDIAEGRALGDVTTLRDPAAMAELEAKVAEEQEKEQ